MGRFECVWVASSVGRFECVWVASNVGQFECVWVTSNVGRFAQRKVTAAYSNSSLRSSTRSARQSPQPKYCVVGGIIAPPHMLMMYRSKDEMDIAVLEVTSQRKLSVKVKEVRKYNSVPIAPTCILTLCSSR